MPSRRFVALLTLVPCLVGCARNAVLEVAIEVPAGPADRFAVVQFESGGVPFESVWARSDDYEGAPLGAAPQTLDFSIVSEAPDTRIQIKVSFCTTPDCSGVDDAPDRAPAVWYMLDRALYIGERTRWRTVIETVPIDPPTGPTMVGRCEIAGCIEAGGGATNFCRSDGRHYCE